MRSLEISLERFKLLLDLVSPLANFESTATTVVGVLRSMTVVSLIHKNMATSEVLTHILCRLLSALQVLVWTLQSKLQKC